MPILIACIFAVLLAVAAAVAATMLVAVIRLGGEDFHLLLGLVLSALGVSIAVAGGLVYGQVVSGIWQNAGLGAVLWFVSALVLLIWGSFVLDVDMGDVVKRLVLYGVITTFFVGVWLALYRTAPAGPLRWVMKRAVRVQESVAGRAERGISGPNGG